jgi:hypothetical protein
MIICELAENRHDGNHSAEHFALNAAGKVRRSSAHCVIATL